MTYVSTLKKHQDKSSKKLKTAGEQIKTVHYLTIFIIAHAVEALT